MTLGMTGVAAVLLSAFTLHTPRGEFMVQAENGLNLTRPDEVLSISWQTVTTRLPGVLPSAVRARDAGSGREVPTQVLDADGNGTPDSLLVLADFRPRERRRFIIEPLAAAAFTPRTAVRHDAPRDDMAWESDKLAWRIYGQGLKQTSSAMSSSGVDIWVKKTRALVVEKWYAKGHDAYHVDEGEGADFYDVGESLGAGGTALWVGDSLVRADNFTRWTVIATGPIRSIFAVEYPAWSAGPWSVSQTKRITIDAGASLYKEESTFHPVGNAPKEIPYVIGELKRPGMVGSMSKARSWAWMTGWGPTTPKKGGDGEIGTAIVLPAGRVRDWKETATHYLAVTFAQPNVPVVHFVGAGWTLGGEILDVQDWWRYLDESAQRYAAPITLTVTTP